MPTGKAVAAGAGVAGGTVTGGRVPPGAEAVLVSEGMSVEVASTEGVSLCGVLLGGGAALGANGVAVLGAGAQTLAVAVTIAMAVADGRAGPAVAVTSTGVGALGVEVPTTQPAHKSVAAKIRLPSLRRSISSL